MIRTRKGEKQIGQRGKTHYKKKPKWYVIKWVESVFTLNAKL